MNNARVKALLHGRRVDSERMTARQLLGLNSTQRSNIQDIKFVVPQLGTRRFGSFVVRYKRPVFVSE